jgi:integrase
MTKLLYGSGLRLMECIRLRVRNLDAVEKLHQEDLAQGCGEVYLPDALARKYPNAAKSFGWQYVFPSKTRSIDPRSGKMRRHHVLESGLQKAVRVAVGRVGLTKPVGCHTFRHHADVKTTEIYTHVMGKNISAVLSPLDRLS